MIGDLISEITSGLTGMGNSVITFLKEAFLNIIYVDPTASTRVVSDFAKFGFGLIGLSLALGLTYFIVNLIRRKI